MNHDNFWYAYKMCQEDWGMFAKHFLRVNLDDDQMKILRAIQKERRVAVRSGTARGKDFVAAVASLCFLYLTTFDAECNYHSTKVVNTAPTYRQIRNIMMPEISKMYARLPKSDERFGKLLVDGIRFYEEYYKDWFLAGFKASDDDVEAWSGLHAENVMVVFTEASGMSNTISDTIEGILQGNSRLVLIGNPNRISGEYFHAFTSPLYHKFSLSDLNAPNVENYKRVLSGEITEQEYKKLHIPGQVDYDWVDEKIKKPGWVSEISQSDVDETKFDFEWNGKYYRPGDLFRVKVMGEFPVDSEDVLIPMSWLEAAYQRYENLSEQDKYDVRDTSVLKLGVDIAGMGRDNSIYCHRYKNLVLLLETIMNENKDVRIHMQNAGKIKSIISKGGYAFIDTIGEGAGVYSRLAEQEITNAISAKVSESAEGLKDFTGEIEFANMRAYLYWALRDALNPAYGINLAIPRNDFLTEEIGVGIQWNYMSNGKIAIESKEKIKERLGRSPDVFESIILSYWPEDRITENYQVISKSDLGGIL